MDEFILLLPQPFYLVAHQEKLRDAKGLVAARFYGRAYQLPSGFDGSFGPEGFIPGTISGSPRLPNY